MKYTTIAITLLGLTCSYGQSTDFLNNFGIGAHAGTQGFGGHLTYDINEKLYLRGEFNLFSFTEEDLELDDIIYDGELDLSSFGVTLNYVPWESGFRVSAGLFSLDNTVSIDANAADQELTIGDTVFDTGGLNDRAFGEAGFDTIAPYVGIGVDLEFGRRDQWAFSVDLGVLFVGEPDVDFRVEGTAIEAAITEADIQAEEDSISDDIEAFQFYPVFKIGLTYRF